MEIPHFTPWDHNWPFGPPRGAQGPRLKEFVWQDPNDPCRQSGSIIGCETQTLGEILPVAGVPYKLVYQSDRVPGWKVDETLRIPVTGPTLPPDLKGIQLQIEIAGERYEWRWCDATLSAVLGCSELPRIAPNLTHTFRWSGLDAYDREVYGRVTAHVRVMYVYEYNYYSAPADFQASFAQFPDDVEVFDGRRCGDPFFCGIPIAQHMHRGVGAWDASAADGLGGWTLDIHHAYDPRERVLHLGNGVDLSSDALGSTTVTVAGRDHKGYPDAAGMPANDANLGYLIDIATAPDGSIYTYSHGDRNHIVKIGPDGIAKTIAGNSHEKGEPTGDGGPALQATLGFEVLGLAVGPDGSLYFTAIGKNYPAGYIRKIDPNGIITTIAGVNDASPAGGNGDNGLAVNAKISAPIDLVFGPDGSLYFGERAGAPNGNRPRIRKIDPNGIVTTVAGGGTVAMADLQANVGIPATDVNLATPYGLAFGPDGSLYIAHTEGRMVTRVGIDGMITRFAGNGDLYVGYDGEPAAELPVGSPVNVAVDREGAVYIRTNTGIPPVRIVRVGTDGILKFLAGGSLNCMSGSKDGEPAQQTCIGHHSRGLEVAPDGALIFTDGPDLVRRLGLPLPSFGPLGYVIPSQDGSMVYEFDANGRHLRTYNSLNGGLIHRFVYDTAGRLSAVVDGDDNVTQIERAEDGRPTAIIAPDGRRTTLETDGNGYLSAVIDPRVEGARGTARFTYGDGGLLATYTDPNGGVSRFTYSPDGRLERDEDPTGGYKTLARVETDRAVTVTVTSKLGRSTVYAMEILPNGDRLRSVRDAAGATTTLRIRADGTHTTIGPDGTRTDTVLAPDPRWGMVVPYPTTISMTLPSGLHSLVTIERSAELGDAQNPLSVKKLTERVTINGKPMTTSYDAAARTFTAVSAGGRRTVVTLDEQGRTIQEAISNLSPTSFTYDEQGRLDATIQGSGELERRYVLGYSAAGHLESITDPLGRVARFSYNAIGLATAQTLADNTVIAYGYNSGGALTSVTPAGRPAHTFIYDADGQMTAYTAPAVAAEGPHESQTTYSYDDDGMPTRVTRADGQSVEFSYDGSGRLVGTTAPHGAFAYSYDAASNPVEIAAPGGVKLTHSFDGPLLTGESWDGPVQGSVEYVYDPNLRLVGGRVNGVEVAYSYDNDGLLTAAGALSLARDWQTGMLIASTLDSVVDSWAYDEFGQATQYQARAGATELYRVAYSYDKLGRIIEKTETIGGVSTIFTYRYDFANRLDQVTRNGEVIATYMYDANGNRLTGPGVNTPAVYDDQDRLLRYGDADYTYRASGELASKTVGGKTTSYQYDALGNLTTVGLPDGEQIEYVVDGLNRRIGKRVNGKPVQGFLYQGRYNLVAELDGAGNVVSRFIYGAKSHVPDSMIKGGVTYRIISDHVGSPRLVVNTQTGEVVQRIDYSAWGNVVADSNPGFQPFGFAGGLYDRDTQLTRFGARDYDVTIGRWTAKDPLGFDGGDTNLYAYAENDPVNLIDPTGTIVIVPIVIGVWALIEVGLSVADAISTANTLMDDCTSVGEKVFAAGVFAAGLLLPGAGYAYGARLGKRAPRVLGNFPEYVDLAKRIPGSKHFSVPEKAWNAMTEAQQWAANQKFLDRGIRQGAEFILATPPWAMRAGSALEVEIAYLLNNGYRFTWNRLSLVPW